MDENRRILEIFLDCMAASRVGPMGGWLGIDRPSLESTLRMCKVEDTEPIYRSVRAIETAALAEYGKHRQREAEEREREAGRKPRR